MVKRALVPLAAGFEEIEAVAIIDVLRRAGVEVVVAAVGENPATGSHGIVLGCDMAASAVDAAAFDALVLPGGMPGTRRLAESTLVRSWVRGMAARGKLVAAICAAPTVLEACGVLAGRRATSHPNHAAEMRSCRYEEKPVVRDGNFITSRGAGTALAFAAALVEHLVGADAARDVLIKIVYAQPR
jgi:4-methyl-5(b-hydroxyethyl)-thiazole monophosphate biosynthesis